MNEKKDSFWKRLWFDVVLPALKIFIVTAITEGVRYLLFGDPKWNGSKYPERPVSYASYYSDGGHGSNTVRSIGGGYYARR